MFMCLDGDTVHFDVSVSELVLVYGSERWVRQPERMWLLAAFKVISVHYIVYCIEFDLGLNS
jgi:hypothetical protein